MLEKRDPITGAFLGYRPLGITEKDRCAILSCLTLMYRPAFHRHFTSPPPEDVERRKADTEDAKTAILAATMKRDATVSSSASAAVIATANATPADAQQPLTPLESPLPVVTNWAFSKYSCDSLGRL